MGKRGILARIFLILLLLSSPIISAQAQDVDGNEMDLICPGPECQIHQEGLETGTGDENDEEEVGLGHGEGRPQRPTSAPVPLKCALAPSFVNELRSYKGTVQNIVQEITIGSFKARAYDDLATFVDKFGPRMAGGDRLDKALTYLKKRLVEDGLSNVHTENVEIPYWVRGYESAELIEPWSYPVATSAYYNSAGTPVGGITAEIVVLFNTTEIKQTPVKFRNKIVLCYVGCDMPTMGKIGAKAVLSGTHAFGLHDIRRGLKAKYNESIGPNIPITMLNSDDTEMFARIYKRGKNKLVLKLEMYEPTIPATAKNATSRNVVGEYRGSSKPTEIVGVAGHIDSWDVGQGAQDDGFGAILAMTTLKLFKAMNLQPKRSVRIMLWTTEEIGEWGSRAYIARHAAELKKFQAQVEADSGCFNPVQLNYNGNTEFGCTILEIYKMIRPHLSPPSAGSDSIAYSSHWSSDSDGFDREGVPTVGLRNPGSIYSEVYHSNADTMTKVSSKQLDNCLAIYSAVVYVLADINSKTTRD